MTEAINTDPPQTIEPTTESAPDPLSSSNLAVHAIEIAPDGVPSGDFLPLDEVPLSLLLELASNGNEAAARELAWRMDADPGEDTATTDEEPA